MTKDSGRVGSPVLTWFFRLLSALVVVPVCGAILFLVMLGQAPPLVEPNKKKYRSPRRPKLWRSERRPASVRIGLDHAPEFFQSMEAALGDWSRHSSWQK